MRKSPVPAAMRARRIWVRVSGGSPVNRPGPFGSGNKGGIFHSPISGSKSPPRFPRMIFPFSAQDKSDHQPSLSERSVQSELTACTSVQTIDKPIFFDWGCMKGPQPLHIESAATACTPRGRGPSGRFFYHFLAVAEGNKKMMQLEKMKSSFFRRVLALSTPRTDGVYVRSVIALCARKSPKRFAGYRAQICDFSASGRVKALPRE